MESIIGQGYIGIIQHDMHRLLGIAAAPGIACITTVTAIATRSHKPTRATAPTAITTVTPIATDTAALTLGIAKDIIHDRFRHGQGSDRGRKFKKHHHPGTATLAAKERIATCAAIPTRTS